MEKIRETIWVCTSKTTSSFDKSNGDSEPRHPNFIGFLLLIDQDIWNDL